MKHQGTKTLETERLVLRRFRDTDAQAMFDNWACDPEVTRFLTWEPHQSINVTQAVLSEWVSGYEQPDFYQWAIVPKEGDGRPVGSIGAVKVFDKISAVQIGYCIGRKWWHRGITSEALKALIVFFFDEVGVERIEAIHDTHNPNSGGVMEKCGMKHEGTLRRAFKGNSGIGDVKIYSILKSDL